MDFILCANPWGYRFGRREDADGYSIICHDEEYRALVCAIIDGLPGYGVAPMTRRIDNYD